MYFSLHSYVQICTYTTLFTILYKATHSVAQNYVITLHIAMDETVHITLCTCLRLCVDMYINGNKDLVSSHSKVLVIFDDLHVPGQRDAKRGGQGGGRAGPRWAEAMPWPWPWCRPWEAAPTEARPDPPTLAPCGYLGVRLGGYGRASDRSAR